MDEQLLKILVCTKCKGSLIKQKDCLICENCRLKYKIEDGIPNMILEDAEKF